jgi:diazepam-binding inhibitor (GABA receptor modulating acyl-CoA-binding protein)
LTVPGLPLVARRTVVGHQGQLADFLSDGCRYPGVVAEASRVIAQAKVLTPEVATDAYRGDRNVGQWLQDQAPEGVVVIAFVCKIALLAGTGRGCHRQTTVLRRLGPVIGQRVDDAKQGDAIANRMVDAHDQCGIVVGHVDEVEFPARPCRIEWSARHLGDKLLQFVRAAGRREKRVANVRVDVEVWVVDPPPGIGVLGRNLPKASVAQHTPGDCTLEPLGVDTALENHHTQDLHQVLGPVHAKPGGVDMRNSLARSHRVRSLNKWQAHIIASHFSRSSTRGTTVSDLQAQFEAAVASSKSLPERPDNTTLLTLYALYKQASDGDVEGRRPGFTDMVGRAKYDAWAAIKGTPAAGAMQQYIALIEKLKAI